MKRSSLEIVAAILRSCVEPMRIIQIQGEILCDHRTVKKYVMVLVANGLLSKHYVPKGGVFNGYFYRTTEKGFKFLEAFKKIEQLLGLEKQGSDLATDTAVLGTIINASSSL